MGVEILTPDLGDIPYFPVEKPDPRSWRDGVVIRTPNWLGDVILTIPAMMQLRTVVPEKCGIFAVCPKGLAPILESMPGVIDKVIPLENAHSFPSGKEFMTVRSLSAGAGILFNNSFRDALWMKATQIPLLYGASARNRGWLLNRSFPFPKRRDFVLNRPHHAAKYLSMVMALGASAWDGTLPEFQLMFHRECASDAVLRAVDSDAVLAIAPGAAYGDAKRWDTDSFRAVCRWWIGERKGIVVVLSAKNEAESASLAVEGLPEDSVVNLTGKTTLMELMKILQHAECCIANDSGTMHLSAALGGCGVAPFGSTDPAATSPISPRWKILFDKLDCAPCFKRICPKGTKECLSRITPEEVIRVIRSF